MAEHRHAAFELWQLRNTCSVRPINRGWLDQQGLRLLALGHIHKRERLVGPDPWIIYPGNPQGRHIREAGSRGCVVATVEGSRIAKTPWHDVDVIRWQVCKLDASNCSDADGVTTEAESAVEQLLTAAEGRPLAIRIEVHGATTAHRELMRHADHWGSHLRNVMLDRFDEQIWIEKIKICTQSHRTATAWQKDEGLCQLLEGIADADSFRTVLSEVRQDYEQLIKYLPTDPRLIEPAIALDDPRWEQPDVLFADVEEMLIGRLLSPGDQS